MCDREEGTRIVVDSDTRRLSKYPIHQGVRRPCGSIGVGAIFAISFCFLANLSPAFAEASKVEDKGFRPVLQETEGGSDLLALSASGKWLIAGRPIEQTFRLFDVKTGVYLRTLYSPVPLAKFAIVDDSAIDVLDQEGHRWLLDVASGQATSNNNPTPTSQLIHPEAGGTVAVPDLAPGVKAGLIKQLQRNATVSSLKVTRDVTGRYFAASLDNSTFAIWDSVKGRPVGRLNVSGVCDPGSLNAFAVSGDIVALSMTSPPSGVHVQIALFDLKNGPRVRWHSPCQYDEGTVPILSPSGRLFSRDEGLIDVSDTHVWDLSASRQIELILRAEGPVVFSRDETTMAVRSHPQPGLGPGVYLVIRNGKRIAIDAADWFQVVAVSPTGQWIAVASDEGAIVAYNVDQIDRPERLPRPDKRPGSWSLHVEIDDSGLVFATTKDAYLQGQSWRPRESEASPMRLIASPLCNNLVCDHKIDDSGVVLRQFNIDNLQALLPSEFINRNTNLAVSPDNRYLVIDKSFGHEDQTHHLFFVSLGSGKTDGRIVIHSYKEHALPLNFTPDNKALIVDNKYYFYLGEQRPTWTIEQVGRSGFAQVFRNGALSLSPGAESAFRLVRGLDVLPPDASAISRFEDRGR